MMTWLVKRTICLLLSTIFALSTMAVASAATCATSAVGRADGAMAMACCMEHKTSGMNAPCKCSFKSAPATPAQTTLSTNTPESIPDFVAVLEPKVFVSFHQEPINSQWLASDIRLRAPPKRLYLINCSFLE
jgi:hypothetical protein